MVQKMEKLIDDGGSADGAADAFYDDWAAERGVFAPRWFISSEDSGALSCEPSPAPSFEPSATTSSEPSFIYW
jgi:hypothetical protein